MNFLLAQQGKSGVKVSAEGVESSVLTLGTVVDDGESDERGVDGLDDAGGAEQGTAKTRNSPMGTIGVSIICPILDVTLQILFSLIFFLH